MIGGMQTGEIMYLIYLINVTIWEYSTLHAQTKIPLHVYWIDYKTFNILTEPNDDYFEQQSFILSQKLTEKVQLILQLLHPYTLIQTSTVIREMRVLSKSGMQ